ncbi:MAG TPA: sortase [Aeromicrobium sp.]|nr:sortase [Aeromicrobium sp.]
MRRFIQLIGWLMIIAGLGFVAWFAWQYWGTNIVSEQKQQEILDDWENTDAIGVLRVPRFGTDYEVPIMPGGNLVDAKGREALSLGVAWYELGERPGEIGNFVVAGDGVTHGEPFADFPRLKAGDKVNVETREDIFTYVLRNGGTQIIVPFTVSWPLDSVPDPKRMTEDPTEPLMTMVTCSELFHTANRSVVVGELRSTRDKATGRVTNRAPSLDPWPEPSTPTS